MMKIKLGDNSRLSKDEEETSPPGPWAGARLNCGGLLSPCPEGGKKRSELSKVLAVAHHFSTASFTSAFHSALSSTCGVVEL